MKVNKSKYKVKQKVPVVIHNPTEGLGPIAHPFGEISGLDPDRPTCTVPGCGRYALCSRVIDGHYRPHDVCMTHWVVWYRTISGVDSQGNPVGSAKKIRKGSVTNAVLDLIESKKKHNPTCEEMKNTVLSVKPDSKFNQGHYNWYLNEYKKGRLRRKVWK
jgi:hypothetical protein